MYYRALTDLPSCKSISGQAVANKVTMSNISNTKYGRSCMGLLINWRAVGCWAGKTWAALFQIMLVCSPSMEV